MSSWTGCTSTSDANAWNRCTKMSFETALGLEGDAMDLGITGLRVLITAGASGIGLEVARAFVREGARVHVCDVDRAALDSLADSDPQIDRTVADVADRARVALLFEEAPKTLGGLDV